MGFILWLNKSGAEGEQVVYDIVFSEDVKGLSVGSRVLYTGIVVGEVASLHLDPEDPSKVWTRIQIGKNTPVRTTTTARMSLANITGASVILLENNDPSSPPLPTSEYNVPIIPTKPSPFNQLKTSGEELLLNVSRLVNNANDVFSRENSDNLTAILQNLQQTTAALASQKGAISQGISDLASSSADFKSTIAQTTRLLEQFNEQFDARGGDLFISAGQSLEALRELSTNLNNLVTDNREALSHGIDGLAELGPVIRQLEEVVSNLSEISRRLDEDPGSYFLNREKIREYHQ